MEQENELKPGDFVKILSLGDRRIKDFELGIFKVTYVLQYKVELKVLENFLADISEDGDKVAYLAGQSFQIDKKHVFPVHYNPSYKKASKDILDCLDLLTDKIKEKDGM